MNNTPEKNPGIEEELPEKQLPSPSPLPEDMVEESVPEEIIESPSDTDEAPETPLPQEPVPEPDPELPETTEPDAELMAESEASPEATAEAEATEELGTELLVEEEMEAEPSGISMPLFAGGLVCACLLGALISALVGKALKGGIAPIKASKLRSLAVHGLGARSDQQDACYCSDVSLYGQQGLLMCVADGMGGLSNGSIYSRSAVSAVASKFSQLDRSNPEKLVSTLTLNAVAAVNRVISPNFGSGGTTLLIGYIQNGVFYYSSVGDSRICLYRDGALFHLNRPHDYEADLMLRHVNNELSFEQVKTYEKRGALTSYLGMGALRYADMAGTPIALRRGDRVVLMSDGVFNTLSDAELCSILALSSRRIEQELEQAIEGKKLKYQDNYTAVILAAD